MPGLSLGHFGRVSGARDKCLDLCVFHDYAVAQVFLARNLIDV